MTILPHNPALAAPGPKLSAICVLDLVIAEIPVREKILSPWFSQRDIAMLHAPRGCGKTLVGLTIGLAVASGGNFTDWSAPVARKVLIVDGEMSARTMQERFKGLLTPYQKSLAAGMIRIITPDLQERAIPDLSTTDGQELIESHLVGTELLILDNLSTLCRTGVENDAESWTAVQAWMLSLRRRGISVLLIHHSGKTGLQRGTSRREDILDIVVGLRRPQDYVQSQGARFDFHFEKSRGVYGAEVEPRELTLQTDSEGSLAWTWRTIGDRNLETVASLLNEGTTIRDAAEELGISKSKVARLKKQAKEKGILKGKQ